MLKSRDLRFRAVPYPEGMRTTGGPFKLARGRLCAAVVMLGPFRDAALE